MISVNIVTTGFGYTETNLGTVGFYGVNLQHNFLASRPNIGDIPSFGIGITLEWGYLVTDTVERMTLASRQGN